MTPKIEESPKQVSTVHPLLVTKDITNSKYYADPLALLGERSFKEPQDIPDNVTGTPIQEYYRNKTIFLTGGTGFMGKILVEKLLRSCSRIKHIYLLIRPKKGKGTNQRLNEIFDDRLFKRLKHEVPKYFEKVSAIAGDCSIPDLGISDQDRKKLQEEVNVVLHGAATVRFNEPLRQAIAINVKGAQAILKLAKGMKNLSSIVHVSTAYANCPNLKIEEKFYESPAPYKEIIETIDSLSDEEIEKSHEELIGLWPNTYSFTKALAEHVIKNESKNLPIAIFRPAVVISTYQEPVRGWIDNLYGPVGLIVGAGTGVLHTYHGDKNLVPDLVPVDLVVNSLISTAWITAKNAAEQEEIKIYNYVASTQNPLPWKDFVELNQSYGIHWPSIRSIWYYYFISFESDILFFLATLFFHKIPGFLLDTLAKLLGKKPMLGKIYDKLDKVKSTLDYFATKEWTFTNDNIQNLWKQLTPEDQEIFFFDMSKVSWDYHSEAHWLGLRVYLLKDDVDTLPAARKKLNRLFYAHLALQLILLILFLGIIWTIYFVFFHPHS